jgi:hypothetical protein
VSRPEISSGLGSELPLVGDFPSAGDANAASAIAAKKRILDPLFARTTRTEAVSFARDDGEKAR